ncbi:MAG: hypothetical protein MUC36_00635 [Planctomycetes bacterium]|jgi:hypothetical protein|nr:hypothetical protein [Planctomycetota bacterium]
MLRLPSLSLCLMLVACAGPAPMPAEGSSSPKLSSERALGGLLELLRDSRSFADITEARLESVLAVPFERAADGKDRIGFGEQVTADWVHGFELDRTGRHGPTLDYSLHPVVAGAHPDLTAVCGVDLEAFGAAMKAMGFVAEPYRAEHGRLIHVQFVRDGLVVTAMPRGESDAKAGHLCLWMVRIQ